MQDAKGQPMQEVSAREKNTTTEIITQANGSCRLAVSSETATLVFSLVGSQSQEITLSGSPTIHTTLPVDYSHIDEVLAIGYQSIRRKDLTGAASVLERQNTSAKGCAVFAKSTARTSFWIGVAKFWRPRSGSCVEHSRIKYALW